jgi:tripartite-type tricarboxylate transporter receptor subunit TctC
MYFGTMPSALPHVKSGKLRALALMSDKRSQLLPSLPTIAEAGLPGMEISVWTGLMAPKATPQSIVARAHADVTRVLALPDTKEKLAVYGLDTVGSTPAEYAEFINVEIAKYAKVIKFADIRPE